MQRRRSAWRERLLTAIDAAEQESWLAQTPAGQTPAGQTPSLGPDRAERAIDKRFYDSRGKAHKVF
jgi:hypothetical protein